MLEHEFLLQMSMMLDKKLEPIKTDIRDVKADVETLKADMHEMDVRLTESIHELDARLTGELAEVRADMHEMDVRLTESMHEMDDISLRADIRNINISLENEVMPRLQNIESCYLSTYKRYVDGIKQIDAIQADVDVMKIVMADHSEKIQGILKLA